MIKWWLLLVVFFVFAIKTGVAQNVAIESRVLDSSGSPIPFAHVYHEDSRSGTVTNLKGFFILNIPTDELNSKVKISSMGFRSEILSVREIRKKDRIILEDFVLELAAVTITPKDYALELMQRVVERIPSNYPDTTEMLRGFMRETVFWNDMENDPIYSVEATVDSRKESYLKKRNGKGHVRVIKGRKYESNQLDTLMTRFYGGLFDAFYGDEVYLRNIVFDQTNHRKFNFSISDTLLYDGQLLFVLEATPRKSSQPKGTIHILDSTYAVVKTDFYYNREACAQFLDELIGAQRQFRWQESEYYQENDGKWRLKMVNYKTAFQTSKRKIHARSEYITTNVSDVFEEIPYLERAQYSDIFLDETGTYDSEFWKNNNVIISDPLIESLYKNQSETEASGQKKRTSKSERIFNIIRKLSGSFSIAYNYIDIDTHTLSFGNSEFAFSNNEESRDRASWNLNQVTSYDLNNGFRIGWNSSSSYSNTYIENQGLLLLKEFKISSGRPVHLTFDIQLGWQNLGYFVGKYSSENDFQLGGKKFNSGSTNVYFESRGHFTQPSVSISLEKSNRLDFFIKAGYNFLFERRSGLRFREAEQLFFKKETFIENGGDGVVISPLNDISKPGLSLSFGIVLGAGI